MCRARLLLPFCLLSFGCAHYQMACPKLGGPQWIEVLSPHFALRTDIGRREAEALLVEQERVLTAFVDASELFLPAVASLPHTAVVLFDQLWEYEKVVTSQDIGPDSREVGRMMPADERGRPMIVLSRVTGGEVFRHELTHRLLRQRLSNVPLWLDEGLAEYLAQVYAKDDRVYLGGLSNRLVRRNERMRSREHPVWTLVIPLLPLLDGHVFLDIPDDAYLSAWALVHYLANGAADHAERFRRFLDAIGSGKPATAALEEHYGALSGLDQSYRAHFSAMSTSNKALQWTTPYKLSNSGPAAVESRLLDDGEVHVMKATLRPSIAAREIKLAQLHAPSSPALHHWRALAADAQDDAETVEREMAAALESATYDQRFYMYERARLRLAHELRRPPARRQLDALNDEMRTIARFVDEPQQFDTVAKFFLAHGDNALGGTFAERAVALDPSCASCLVTVAGHRFASDDLDGAVSALDAAVQRWPGRKGVPREVSAQLSEYRRARLLRQNPAAHSN